MMHGVLDLTQKKPVTPPFGKELAATVKNVKKLGLRGSVWVDIGISG